MAKHKIRRCLPRARRLPHGAAVAESPVLTGEHAGCLKGQNLEDLRDFCAEHQM